MFWLFFILKIALKLVFEKVITDVRSDDEEESEIEPAEKQQEGYISGGERAKGIKGGKINGSVKMANGHAVANHDSFADAVVEGRKNK